LCPCRSAARTGGKPSSDPTRSVRASRLSRPGESARVGMRVSWCILPRWLQEDYDNRRADFTSGGGIARQPRDTVEVGVMAGQEGEAVVLHDSHDQGITGEQTILTAKVRCPGNLRAGDGKDLNADHGNLINRLTGTAQLLDRRRMLLQPPHNPPR